MKRIVILGSAGSIGENAIRVVQALPDRLKVVGLAVNRNHRRVFEQARELGVGHVAIADESAVREAGPAPNGVELLTGADGVEELAALPDADMILCSVVGMAGLRPVLRAVEGGKDVALATKEVLVVGGHLVAEACARTGARLLPVDSEHSAVFQCLEGHTSGMVDPHCTRIDRGPEGVRRIILTASGGPFSSRPDLDFEKVTVAEALNHPNWDMGRKVTIDSATLMNKGLEIMEAHWLFRTPIDMIDVVVHPESIVHSLVEYVDGSMLAQMGLPDMRHAIQHALLYPDRVEGGLASLDLVKLGALHFHAPDEERFPCLGLARAAGNTGGSMPAVLNAANEVAVEKFLAGDLPFAGIWRLVEAVMRRHEVVQSPTLSDVTAIDEWARSVAQGDTNLGSRAQ